VPVRWTARERRRSRHRPFRRCQSLPRLPVRYSGATRHRLAWIRNFATIANYLRIHCIALSSSGCPAEVIGMGSDSQANDHSLFVIPMPWQPFRSHYSPLLGLEHRLVRPSDLGWPSPHSEGLMRAVNDSLSAPLGRIQASQLVTAPGQQRVVERNITRADGASRSGCVRLFFCTASRTVQRANGTDAASACDSSSPVLLRPAWRFEAPSQPSA